MNEEAFSNLRSSLPQEVLPVWVLSCHYFSPKGCLWDSLLYRLYPCPCF